VEKSLSSSLLRELSPSDYEQEEQVCPASSLEQELVSPLNPYFPHFVLTRVGTLIETGGIPQKYSLKDENGKQTIEIEGVKKAVQDFDGKRYLLEPAIKGDVAIVRAWKVDKAGNCVFR
jgi:3-oxoacid CoA-transferase